MQPSSQTVNQFGSASSFGSDEGGPLSWIFAIDQRRIALMQLFGLGVAALIGTALALVLQLERITPRNDVLTTQAFAASFTMHGTVMVFLLLTAAIPGCLAPVALPQLLGARNVAFPRLHLASLQMWVLGGLLLLMAVGLGGASSGWTLSVPLSLEAAAPSSCLAWGIVVIAFSALLRAIVIMTSIHLLRRPGLTWSQLSPFAWSLYAHSVVTLVAAPVLMLTVILLLAERRFGLGIIDPLVGGDPLLFQHFFWFGAHGLAYGSVLPAVGLVSEVLLSLGNQQKQAPRSLLFGLSGLGLLALLSWGMQAPTSGHSSITLAFFSLVTLFSMVPVAQILGSWTLALRQGVRTEAPLWFALCAMALFVVGGLATLPLAALSTAVHLQGTSFAVAQSHFMFGSVAVAFLAGLHLWWSDWGLPSYSSTTAKAGVLLIGAGMFLAFIPLLQLGVQGLPRRLSSYPEAMQPLQVVSAVGALVLSLGLTVVAINLIRTFLRDEAHQS